MEAFLFLSMRRAHSIISLKSLSPKVSQTRQKGFTPLPELQSFASGIEKDKEAVKAGLTWSINNGMVEGHVTKLKLIKRQGYGRAGFPLLRKRVFHSF